MPNYLFALPCFEQAFSKVPLFWNFFRTYRLRNERRMKKKESGRHTDSLDLERKVEGNMSFVIVL